MEGHIRSEVAYLFDIDEASRNVYIWIYLRSEQEMPAAELSVSYINTPGLEAGKIWIDGTQIKDYSIIKIGDNKTIGINLQKIHQDHPELKIKEKIENNQQIEIYLEYKENLSLKKQGNWAQVLINIQSNLSSSNSTLFFCLPKIPWRKRASSYLFDITERKAYEILGFSYSPTTIHKERLQRLTNDYRHLRTFLNKNPKKKNNEVVYFTEEEKYIEQLGSFAFCFPKISTKKLSIRIILYIITIILSGLVGYLINQILSSPS